MFLNVRCWLNCNFSWRCFACWFFFTSLCVMEFWSDFQSSFFISYISSCNLAGESLEECPITGVPGELGFLKTAFMVHPVPLLSSWCYLWFCCLFWWCYSLLCVCGNSQSELEKCRENSTCVTLLFRLFWLVSARDLKMDMGILNEKATFKRLRVSFSSRLK